MLTCYQLLQFLPEMDGAWGEIHRSFTHFLNRLPENFGPRFHFDASLLYEVKELWSEGSAVFPDTLIPVYRRNWQYEPVPMPGPRQQDGRIHHLYLIGVREEKGQNINAPPFLLDYSFLCHELAHYLVRKYGQPFAEQFTSALQKVLRQKARRRMPFRQKAKSQSEKRGDQIEQHWSIEKNGMWAIEIVIDVVVLWTCGPAYLDALAHHLGEYDRKFQITPRHPPAALRGKVLGEAAQKLGWDKPAQNLHERVREWEDEGPSSFNQYRALTDKQIVTACLDAALEYCEGMELPRLTQEDISRIQNRIEQDEELVGTDLIVGAWIVDQQRGEDAYHRWEKTVYQHRTEKLSASSSS